MSIFCLLYATIFKPTVHLAEIHRTFLQLGFDQEEETDTFSLLDKLTALAIQQGGGGEIAPTKLDSFKSKSSDDLDSSISVSYQPEDEKITKTTPEIKNDLFIQPTSASSIADHENNKTIFLDLRQESKMEEHQVGFILASLFELSNIDI